MKSPFRIPPKILGVLLLIVGVAIAGLWLRFRPDSKGRVIPPFERIDMAAHQPFAAGVKASSTVRLFEGLPHQMWEGDMLETELDTKKTFKAHGHHFYQAEITPSEADTSLLAGLATAVATFKEWRGMKACGGYHPDWLVRWTASEGQTHELHICLGCHEAKVYGSGYQLYCDVAGTAYEILKSTLSRYSSQRPQRAGQDGAGQPATRSESK